MSINTPLYKELLKTNQPDKTIPTDKSYLYIKNNNININRKVIINNIDCSQDSFNNQNPTLKVNTNTNTINFCLSKDTPLTYPEINCDNSTNTVNNIDMNGKYDLYIDGKLVDIDVTLDQLLNKYNKTSTNDLLITSPTQKICTNPTDSINLDMSGTFDLYINDVLIDSNKTIRELLFLYRKRAENTIVVKDLNKNVIPLIALTYEIPNVEFMSDQEKQNTIDNNNRQVTDSDLYLKLIKAFLRSDEEFKKSLLEYVKQSDPNSTYDSSSFINMYALMKEQIRILIAELDLSPIEFSLDDPNTFNNFSSIISIESFSYKFQNIINQSISDLQLNLYDFNTGSQIYTTDNSYFTRQYLFKSSTPIFTYNIKTNSLTVSIYYCFSINKDYEEFVLKISGSNYIYSVLSIHETYKYDNSTYYFNLKSYDIKKDYESSSLYVQEQTVSYDSSIPLDLNTIALQANMTVPLYCTMLNPKPEYFDYTLVTGSCGRISFTFKYVSYFDINSFAGNSLRFLDNIDVLYRYDEYINNIIKPIRFQVKDNKVVEVDVDLTDPFSDMYSNMYYSDNTNIDQSKAKLIDVTDVVQNNKNIIVPLFTPIDPDNLQYVTVYMGTPNSSGYLFIQFDDGTLNTMLVSNSNSFNQQSFLIPRNSNTKTTQCTIYFKESK